MQEARQRSFELPTWGGARRGAGRKPGREKTALRHRARDEVRPYEPVHVTFRMAEHVWNLRSERSFVVLHAALEGLRRRTDVRVVHYSIMGNHVHLIVEVASARALGNGMRALAIRIARGLNRMMGRGGPVFEDRYHAHVLRTPAEVRNALRYVLGNFASHARRRGKRVQTEWVDPFTSAAVKAPIRGQGTLWPEPATSAAGTWLLRSTAHPGP